MRISQYFRFSSGLAVWTGCIIAAVFQGTTSRLDAAPIDFKDVNLSPESYWRGPVERVAGTEAPGEFGGIVRTGYFTSGSVEFVNRFNIDPEIEFVDWSGFGVSNQSDATTPGYLNDMSAITGRGYDAEADNYAVVFGHQDAVDLTNINTLKRLPHLGLPLGSKPASLQVTNTTYTALSMLQGDGFAKKFGGPNGDDPDFLLLSIYGTDHNGVALPAVVEFYLADYRFENSAQDYVITEWTGVDLTPLSGASWLYFNVDSTDRGMFGLNTPAYFALDHLEIQEAVGGDVDGDGNVTLHDIDVVCSGVAEQRFDETFDLTGDGALTLLDVNALLGEAGKSSADINFDGEVDFADFLLLASNYGAKSSWSGGDLTCDGNTLFDDFLQFAGQMEAGSDVANVPEPAASHLAWGLVLLFMRPRNDRTCFPFLGV